MQRPELVLVSSTQNPNFVTPVQQLLPTQQTTNRLVLSAPQTAPTCMIAQESATQAWITPQQPQMISGVVKPTQVYYTNQNPVLRNQNSGTYVYFDTKTLI
ncbi:hypothetical protein LSH36_913g01034 [Paralvinella palmiformis]|uniref:Uncharacterized protein n=1 Tax=Paralvinella palmiformis TaxID=53620 RepID=A0AAD9MTU7_9ANNE|nr:hypothetical protein LSH36_913g01034 [Paralvinella palmiformis]